MMAIEERPTPAPMVGDDVDDEDAPTTVYARTILPPPRPKREPTEAGTAPAKSAAPPPAGPKPSRASKTPVVERMSNPDAPIVRDPIVDPPPSLWRRFTSGCSRFADAMMAFFGGRALLSPELPPVPSQSELHADIAHGEHVLLALLRAPRRYQYAAIHLLRASLGARKGSADDYTAFVVHVTLSRTRPDTQGRISIIELRERLPYLPYLGTIMPSLARLEERGVVKLILDTSGGDPMTEILRENVTHIELLRPV